jgi:hypothetical protein
VATETVDRGLPIIFYECQFCPVGYGKRKRKRQVHRHGGSLDFPQQRTSHCWWEASPHRGKIIELVRA